MNDKAKLAIAIFSLALSFALGRYTVPTKTKEETKVTQTDATKENKDIDATKDEHTKTVVTDKKNKDGSEETTTVITDDKVSKTKTDDSTASISKKDSDTIKEVTKQNSHLTISALAGSKISFSGLASPDYGAMVSKDLLGPINMGIFGFSNGFCGVSLGLTF